MKFAAAALLLVAFGPTAHAAVSAADKAAITELEYGLARTMNVDDLAKYYAPDIVLYAFAAPDWACDNAFTAAHNAAVRISTCGKVNGYDVLSLARDALKRIEKLANTTA